MLMLILVSILASEEIKNFKLIEESEDYYIINLPDKELYHLKPGDLK